MRVGKDRRRSDRLSGLGKISVEKTREVEGEARMIRVCPIPNLVRILSSLSDFLKEDFHKTGALVNILFPTCSNGIYPLNIPFIFPFRFVLLANLAFFQPIRKWFSFCSSFLPVVTPSGELFIGDVLRRKSLLRDCFPQELRQAEVIRER